MKTTIRLVPTAEASDDELAQQGWKKQTTLDEARLREVAEEYRTLGYEVFVREFRSGEGCGSCFGDAAKSGQVHGTVWVRPGDGLRHDGELFD